MPWLRYLNTRSLQETTFSTVQSNIPQIFISLISFDASNYCFTNLFRMSPLPQNSDGGILDSANTLPVANPNLFYHPIIGARFTPIHFILIILLIQIPLYMFLSYQGLIKKWTFERYITAKRSYYTVSSS